MPLKVTPMHTTPIKLFQLSVHHLNYSQLNYSNANHNLSKLPHPIITNIDTPSELLSSKSNTHHFHQITPSKLLHQITPSITSSITPSNYFITSVYDPITPAQPRAPLNHSSQTRSPTRSGTTC